jgi:hypothetical protein
MKKAGGIIALIAGIFAVIAGFTTLVFGGLASAFSAKGASTVVGLGWGGIFFAFITIIFGAIAINAKKRAIGIILMISSLLGAILGGTLVAIFMALALVGGLLATIGVGKNGPELASPAPQA